MGLLLWPIALLVFLAWSLAAFVVYGLSDWIAGLVGSAFSGILSADLGPWAAWLMSSLGNIVQFGVIVIWASVSLLIFAAPMLLRRRQKIVYVERGTPDRWSASAWRGEDWRGRDKWRERVAHGRDDMRDLRHIADDMVAKFRKKKWKKKWDD